jgi:hypothetical protein
MDYTPQQPKVEQSQPEYVLVDDVTHKPAPKRGPQTITVVKYDEKGVKQTVEIRVPWLPKPNCKHCRGRGYIGFNVGSGGAIPCGKCYPPQQRR